MQESFGLKRKLIDAIMEGKIEWNKDRMCAIVSTSSIHPNVSLGGLYLLALFFPITFMYYGTQFKITLENEAGTYGNLCNVAVSAVFYILANKINLSHPLPPTLGGKHHLASIKNAHIIGTRSLLLALDFCTRLPWTSSSA